MDAELDRRIRARAGGACEYCRVPQSAYKFRFPIDHVIAQQHGGKTTVANLCLACLRCNADKGPNIAGIDPKSRRMVSLYNPRRQIWGKHFRWRGAVLLGLTPSGRATIEVLAINDPNAIAVRLALMEEGIFPPPSVRGKPRRPR